MKKEEAAGGRGVKEEEAATDIEGVKAEMEDVAVEGDARVGGGGGFGCDPVVEGGGQPCMGPEPLQPAQCTAPPLGAGSAGQWVLPRCPTFSSPEVTFITLRRAFRRLLRHRIRNKGARGGLAAHGGGMGMETPAGKAPVPHP